MGGGWRADPHREKNYMVMNHPGDCGDGAGV